MYRIPEYPVSSKLREDYKNELQTRMDSSWLLPYSNSPLKGLIPPIAVLQTNKPKVHPVIDYQELNTYIDPFMGATDVCEEKLQEWKQQSANVSILDLRKECLQVHGEKSLWPYQTIMFKGKQYCLTRLGFGLNVALLMRSVLKAVLAQDETINRAISEYINDIFINKDVASAESMRKHLEFELTSKDPEKLQNIARVLELEVWEEHGSYNSVKEATC